VHQLVNINIYIKVHGATIKKMGASIMDNVFCV